jgi:hypothetical protein
LAKVTDRAVPLAELLAADDEAEGTAAADGGEKK